MKLILQELNLITAISVFLILILNIGYSKQIRFPLPEEYADSANLVGIEQVRDWAMLTALIFKMILLNQQNRSEKSIPHFINN